ncbi:nucleotide sugar dehydrogenase, partial [Candidatus Pelagibacter sp.]|nr:nucleotide sugar dehydrogenase [Candidatus Pelagibacter sp.]
MIRPCVIGLGYVGLPLLINLSKKFKIVGYDNDKIRISKLRKSIDIFKEFNKKILKNKNLYYSSNIKDIKDSNFYIVAVPTPIYRNKKPNLSYLKNVSKSLSKVINKGDLIFFESTVYPGVTENICKKIIEKETLLLEGKDFFLGYSPERVNPGDKKHSLKKIDKIVAYPHDFRINDVTQLYKQISKKMILTKNIKEAETAKVIENIQRDVNIGLINEIYIVCKKLNISFNNVINLASTKWNFVKYRPGLVGGHCLPVDPYYLSYVSNLKKFKTNVILAGRTINDNISIYLKNELINKLKKIQLKRKKILLCGLTYKENVSDLRN